MQDSTLAEDSNRLLLSMHPLLSLLCILEEEQKLCFSESSGLWGSSRGCKWEALVRNSEGRQKGEGTILQKCFRQTPGQT